MTAVASVVVAYLIDPTAFTTRTAPLDVERDGSLTTGMTVADFRAPTPEDCTTQVAVPLDFDAVRCIG